MKKEYRYDISMEVRYDNNRVFIDSTHIKSLAIERNYEAKNTPVTLLSIVIDKNVADIIINNKDKAKIYLLVYKYVINTEFIIKEVYLEEEFIYFLADTTNKTKDVDYQNEENNDDKDYTKPLLIGLVKQELIDSNKQNIMNEIFVNARVIDMICKYSSNRKLLIEPPNPDIIDKLVVTPITTYTEYIKFLDDKVNIYKDSYYRLFYDFDKTYILSGKGIATYAKGEKKYPIIINITKNIDMDSKLEGLIVEEDRYILNVDESAISEGKNNSSNLVYNNIIGINSDGTKASTNITSDRVSSLLSKTYIQRYNTDNSNNNNSLKSTIENKEKSINIIKHNIDSSILSLNKEFIIKYEDKDKEYTGNYLLINKKEIFSREAEHFCITIVITLAKVK